MLQPIIENSYLVEIPLGTPAANAQRNFNFIPQLEGAEIYSVQAFTATQVGVSPNGATVIAAAGAASVVCTFCVGNDQDIFLYPYYDLIASNNGGLQRMLKNKRLNLTKSFITMLTAANLNANESLIFQFFYRK